MDIISELKKSLDSNTYTREDKNEVIVLNTLNDKVYKVDKIKIVAKGVFYRIYISGF